MGLSDVLFRHFGAKNDDAFLKASGIYRFEVKQNKKALRDVKLNALQNGYLVFSILPPKFKTKIFQKYVTVKFKIWELCKNPECML